MGHFAHIELAGWEYREVAYREDGGKGHKRKWQIRDKEHQAH